MRTLSFDAIENARELGGLKTRDGRTVRRGTLIRCGNLSRATDADVERLLRDFSLSDVVDFRFPAEAGRDPDRIIPGVRYTALNTLPQRMIDGFSQGRVEGEQPTNEEFVAQLIHHATNPAAQELARQMYPAILMDSRSQQYYGDFLRTVLNARGGVLWHCSQGKDRAGLGTAFLLTALGWTARPSSTISISPTKASPNPSRCCRRRSGIWAATRTPWTSSRRWWA